MIIWEYISIELILKYIHQIICHILSGIPVQLDCLLQQHSHLLIHTPTTSTIIITVVTTISHTHILSRLLQLILHRTLHETVQPPPPPLLFITTITTNDHHCHQHTIIKKLLPLSIFFFPLDSHLLEYRLYFSLYITISKVLNTI